MLGPLRLRLDRRIVRAGLCSAAVVALAAGDAGSVGSAPVSGRTGAREAGVAVPIAVSGGKARFEFPSDGPGSQTLVVVSALAEGPGPFAFRLRAGEIEEAGAAEIAPPKPTAATTSPRSIRMAPEPEPERMVGWPPGTRTFHLLVRDGDVGDAGNYLTVQGQLRAVGTRVQVYVDARDAAEVGPEVLRDVVWTFDERVYPVAARTMGLARDVDGDGRFTILISGWLNRLAGGKHAVDGFVRGADLDPSLAAPFSNRCDMMYLSTSLGKGPHLRTVLAHEYTHAVTFSAKLRAAERLGRPPEEEEGWLEEGIAHLAEDLHGFSRTNLDYRVSAFLSCPERYQLAVDDYYAADLFRSHGNRGGTYLFLRWCADRYGPGLIPALIHSDRRGVANLEAATGARFADLYRAWSVALFLGGIETKGARPSDGGFRSLNPRGSFGAWDLAGPRASVVRPGGPADSWTAAGTSSHFAVVEGSASGGVSVEVEGPPGADMQVTAVPLPADLPRIELAAGASIGPDGEAVLHARAVGRGGPPVRLESLSWEPLVPAPDPHAPGFRRASLARGAIAEAFGSAGLAPGRPLESAPIRAPGAFALGGPLVLKLVGVDALGRRASAWAELSPPSPAPAPAEGTPIARDRGADVDRPMPTPAQPAAQ